MNKRRIIVATIGSFLLTIYILTAKVNAVSTPDPFDIPRGPYYYGSTYIDLFSILIFHILIFAVNCIYYKIVKKNKNQNETNKEKQKMKTKTKVFIVVIGALLYCIVYGVLDYKSFASAIREYYKVYGYDICIFPFMAITVFNILIFNVLYGNAMSKFKIINISLLENLIFLSLIFWAMCNNIIVIPIILAVFIVVLLSYLAKKIKKYKIQVSKQYAVSLIITKILLIIVTMLTYSYIIKNKYDTTISTQPEKAGENFSIEIRDYSNRDDIVIHLFGTEINITKININD